jgi:Caspase domain
MIANPAAAHPRAAAAHPRRAVVVGIDDYLSALPPQARAGSAAFTARLSGRLRWDNLSGSVHDALAFRELLVGEYGFPAEGIRLLTDRAATRGAILEAIEEDLIAPSRPGDEAVFYFAGHGSQQENSLSDEDDKLDETLVPWDSARGAADIRDKELRRRFNHILDRGARLTVVLDSCHSGSAARGLPPGARPRMLPIDPRDAADGSPVGPRPEDRGALILSAAQDFQLAWELWDPVAGSPHGVFSRALFEAMARAGAGESAERVFLRAKAKLQAAPAWQDPVLAGNEERRHAPLFGGRTDRAVAGPAVAVRELRPDGVLVLQGGWASGLAPGLELEMRRPGESAAKVRLRVIRVDGPASAEARLVGRDDEGGPGPASGEPVERALGAGRKAGDHAERALGPDDPVPVEPGDLFEPAGWVVDGEPSLRVWIPEAGEGWRQPMQFARKLRLQAAREGVAWVEDPVSEPPTHVLSWRQGGWWLQGRSEPGQSLGPSPPPAAALGALGRSEAPPRLFVHLPVPTELARELRLGRETENSAVERTAGAEGAEYFLVGRLGAAGVEYAWVRPGVGTEDELRSVLPLRSDWYAGEEASRTGSPGLASLARQLEDKALRLAKIRAWLTVEPPPGDDFPYRLALRSAKTGASKTGGELLAGETFGVLLRARREDLDGRRIVPRYVYVFTLDSFGKSTLLYPRSSQGGVENRLPLNAGPDGTYPEEIAIPPDPLLRISQPFGTDTYFLLTTVEPIATPTVLEFEGVRLRGPRGHSLLEELLSQRGSAMRGSELVTPLTWSLERLSFRSVQSPR